LSASGGPEQRDAGRQAACVAAVFVLAAAVRLIGPPGAAPHWSSGAAGALTAAFAALAGARVAGPWGAAGAGLAVALSPIHVLASRLGAPGLLPILCLAASLALALRVDESGAHLAALAHGALLGVLGASGSPGEAGLAALQLAWLAFRPERRRAAAFCALAALLVLAGAGVLGLLRSPFAPIEAPGFIPATTLSSLVRCSGASFTRIAGIEYHLVVPHARWVSPLTLGVIALAVLGFLRTKPRLARLLAACTILPFLLGPVLALASGRVTPLQATRLEYALPFLAVLEGAGLASLRGRTRVVVAVGLAAVLAGFLALALARG
jgi:hypothetical protein